MKALVYTGTQELVYRDEPNPIEVSGESILKIHASGICGSDMHAYHGHDERRIPPLILGHEVSGEVQNGKFKGKDVVSACINPKSVAYSGFTVTLSSGCCALFKAL